LTDEQKIKEAYKLLRSVNDDITRLFSVAWNRVNNISAAERSLVEKLLKTYDYEAVRDAFEESVAHGKMSLAYVRTVAQNMYEQRSAKKEIKQAEDLKKEPVYDFTKDPEFQKLMKKTSVG
jgi:hypothetical protein